LKIKRLICFVLIAAAWSIPAAGTTAGDKDAENAKPGKNWSLSLKGGFTLNAGNSQSLLVSGGLKFNLKLKRFQYLTVFDAFFGISNDEENVNKGNWLNKLSRQIGKRLNLYGTTNLEYDKFSDIALRTGIGLGVQYILADTAKTAAKIGTTLNGEFTNVMITGDNIEAMRGNIDFSLSQKLSTRAEFSLDTLFTGNLGSFFDDYRWETRAAFSVGINKTMALKIEINEKYTHRPVAEQVKRNDFILLASLEVSL
jgi:putative salt-induced outer membrane protein YdiY